MEPSSIPIGRLAPSPTGAQHLGNARSYLLAWASIRQRNGGIIFRIEDIDSPRVKPWAVRQAMDDLAWLGLNWDEGPDVGGPSGPYIQTQRCALYTNAISRLRALNQVYPCVCTRRDIEDAASAPHESIDGPVYPGTCSMWNEGDPLPEIGSFCWRFRVRDSHQSFTDDVSGAQSMNPARSLGDFPVTRKSGEAAYQLAVVVDDIAMGVTDVLRGNDLLPSTFRQLELYRAMKHPPPRFAHVPLVRGADGRRLAKRHGDTRLSYFREQGCKPESIVGWSAWSAGIIDRWELLSPSELLSVFDLQKVRLADTLVDQDTYLRLMTM
ncbi:MAG: tRNA glutamyl-Q(34) synthetase GluQRS [Pirellulaceae bacterium]